jgi:hypothetical protein
MSREVRKLKEFQLKEFAQFFHLSKETGKEKA